MFEIVYEDIEQNEEYKRIIENILKQCFKEEEMNETKWYISVTLTSPINIKKINAQYRGIDKETDVLSFPMFEKDNLIEKIEEDENLNYDILGDIIISIQTVQKQAIEFEHSFERELSYMVVHGFYHLMCYDHIEDKDKIEMRLKEDKILNELKINR